MRTDTERGLHRVSRFTALLAEVRACTICAAHLPLGPRPVLQIAPSARLLIAGQAPGRKVHESGVPFDDASGERMRDWLGITREVFYDPRQVAILPMGFCYPGTGRSGDLPPRPECAPAWRTPLLSALKRLRLTLLGSVNTQQLQTCAAGDADRRQLQHAVWRDEREQQ